jgi:hypothetical protein
MTKKKRPPKSASEWNVDDQQSRNLAKREMKDAHDILRPIIHFGQKLLRAGVRDSDHYLDRVMASSYRQTLEFVDGVDLLLRHHMVTPAGAQARSALESAVQTCYLLRGAPRLAAAYVLAQIRSKRQMYEGRTQAPNVNEEQRQELRELVERTRNTSAELAALHPAFADALAELETLRDGEPWYRVFAGPRTIHDMMARLGHPSLSIHYRELNSVVHVGLPTAALAGAMPGTGPGEPSEWLRPLRSVTDWWTMPLKVGIVSADIATQAYIVQYNWRYPHWLDEMLQFQKEHSERCTRAGIPDLAMDPEIRTRMEEFRAAARESA